MSLRFLLFTFLIIGLNSCRKEEIIKEELIYQDLTPAISIQSIIKYETDGRIIPQDSSAIHNFDVDLDGVDDYRIVSHHHYTQSDANCGRQSYYTYWVSLEGLSEDKMVAQPADPDRGLFYREEVIDASNIWTTHSLAYLQGGCGLTKRDFYGQYFAVRMGNSFGYVRVSYGTFNSVWISIIAFDPNEYEPIECGQIPS